MSDFDSANEENRNYNFIELKNDLNKISIESENLSEKQIISKAIEYHSHGNIKEAEKYYEFLFNRSFEDPRLYINYGVICKQSGNIKRAIELFRKSIKIFPNIPSSYSNLAIILRSKGELEEAKKLLLTSIKIKPDFAEAYSNLANILIDLGDFEEAELTVKEAIKIKPDFVDAYNNLGQIFKNLGKTEEAKSIIIKSLKINPDNPFTNFILGSIYQESRQLEQSEYYLRKTILINPKFLEAYLKLSCILRDLMKLQEAESVIRSAIKLNQNSAEFYNILGAILIDQGKTEDALLVIKKSIKLHPQYAEAHYNLAIILRLLGRIDESINSFREAISYKEDFSNAKASLIRAESLVCDWSNFNSRMLWLDTLGIKGDAVDPFPLMSLQDQPQIHLDRAVKWSSKNIRNNFIGLQFSKKDKIRIGYFSSDFYNHATMYLMIRIFESHNRNEFEVYAYDYGQDISDIMSERFKKNLTEYRYIRNLNEIESVSLARNDKLDIAIDLKGHTSDNRISIFAQRVAPIQISYLGYPGTTGIKNIDYIIADKIVIPKSNEKYYTEKIINMPNCYQCNDDTKIISKNIFSRRELGLPKDGFVFTCFNANYKITPREFDIWMRLLSMIDSSVLWLYKSNNWAIENLRIEARNRNINPNRLIFSEKIKLDNHLSRLSCADLALDTFNYNGHTTSSDALWAGLPVLTKIGNSFSARVTASLLTNLDLTELITYSEDEYEFKAKTIANNIDQLSELKAKLERNKKTSLLFNSKQFTFDLERKFKDLIN